MNPRPTLVSLAAALGVSRQTVSNVINAPERVHPDTRARVEAEIQRTGYIPARAGRQLRTGRSQVIALRLAQSPDGISGTVLDRFLHSVVRAARLRQHHVLIVGAESDADEVQELVTLHRQGEIDGVILHSTGTGDPRPGLLRQADIPHAAFGRFDEEYTCTPWADVAGVTGTYEAAAALLAESRGPAGFVGWPEGSFAGDDRRSGWSRAMREHGADADLWCGVENSIASGRAAAAELFARGARSFVCASDSLALGVYDFLRGEGLSDFSERIIGFDNTSVARSMGIRSVGQPLDDVAAFLIDELLTCLSLRSEHSMEECGHSLRPSSQIFPSTFV